MEKIRESAKAFDVEAATIGQVTSVSNAILALPGSQSDLLQVMGAVGFSLCCLSLAPLSEGEREEKIQQLPALLRGSLGEWDALEATDVAEANKESVGPTRESLNGT
jgi:hypothetical protein